MMLFLRLAIRNIFRHRTRTIVALLAVAAGCMALILNGGIVFNIFRELREDAIHGRLGHLQIHHRGYSSGGAASDELLLSVVEARSVMETASAHPEVTAVTKRREFSGLVASRDRYVPFLGLGVNPADDGVFGRHLTINSGRRLDPAQPYGVIAGQGLAHKLGVEPGESLRLIAVTPSGALTAIYVTLIGVFQSGLKEYDDWALKVPIATMSHLIGDDHIQEVVVLVADTARVDVVRSELDQALAAAGLSVETRAWHELALFHNQVVSLFGRELDILQLVVVTIVILAIGNAIGMSIIERRAELATLRAMGLRRTAIASVLLTEAALTGVIGAAIGLALATGLAELITAIGIPYPSPPGSTRPFTGGIDLVPGVMRSAAVLSIAASLAAAAVPVWSVVRRPIAPGLRTST